MIALKLEGRLGNQLFQYAFIYAASKKLNTKFYLDKSVENFLLPQYFAIENDMLFPLDNWIFSINGFKNIFSVHIKKAFYKMLESTLFSKRKIIISNDEPIVDALNKLKNHYIYQGYFQSETYFKNFRDDIRKTFKVRDEHRAAFSKIKQGFSPIKKQVVIHIRRNDYVGSMISLPASYYKKAIELINNHNLEYIFISDDPSFVETEFNYIPNKYISNNSQIIDLQFLINADICILSNSSFSWWGAWLNTDRNKQVFAPKYWLGFKEEKEFPTGISDHINVNWVHV